LSALRNALTANREAIALALPEAEQELADCRRRCDELEEEIRRARLIVGQDRPQQGPMTLHEAMSFVLRDLPDGLPAPEMLRAIVELNLYRRRDGGPPDIGQIHARVYNYPKLFVRGGGRIRLRRSEER
jgi:hypothetical protein